MFNATALPVIVPLAGNKDLMGYYAFYQNYMQCLLNCMYGTPTAEMEVCRQVLSVVVGVLEKSQRRHVCGKGAGCRRTSSMLCGDQKTIMHTLIHPSLTPRRRFNHWASLTHSGPHQFHALRRS
eukprot:PhM_4_TR207/c0_g1_i1/m.47491